MDIQLKRIYDPAAADDGRRVLVDRLWPRGVSKQQAAIDDWMKDLAPSQALRQWFGHDSRKWPAFRRRYRDQLEAAIRQSALQRLRQLAATGRVTLVYAARDTLHNNAVVVADRLRNPAP